MFHLPIIPPKATSQGAGKRMFIPKDKEGRMTGRPMFFKNKDAAGAEHDYLILCAPHKPSVPMTGPLKLQVDFVFPWRKSETKKRMKRGRCPNDNRPDCDNLGKMLCDVLTKLCFYKDDGQVADLHITKAWGDNVGVYVQLAPIDVSDSEMKSDSQSSLF